MKANSREHTKFATQLPLQRTITRPCMSTKSTRNRPHAANLYAQPCYALAPHLAFEITRFSLPLPDVVKHRRSLPPTPLTGGVLRADDMADIAREPEACTYILCVVVVKDHAAFCHKQTFAQCNARARQVRCVLELLGFQSDQHSATRTTKL